MNGMKTDHEQHSSGGSRILERGVLLQAAEGSRTEASSADQSARSGEKNFRLYFSVIRVGSRGTFVLCTASSRCERIAGPGAAMCFRFLLKFRSCNVIATRTRSYVHVNILDRGLVPKPFGFSQLQPAVNFVPGTTVLRTVTATYVFRSVLDSCSSPLQASA